MSVCPACGHENIQGAEACDNCGGDLAFLSAPKASSRLDRSLHQEPVQALGKHSPVVVTADRKVKDVLVSLVTHCDGCAVVVDDHGSVLGVFSERDLLSKVAGRGEELLERPVRDFMTPDPVVIETSAPIAYALHQMALGGYRHLPLVQGGKPVGMVSIRDIVTFICDRFLRDS